MGTNTAITPGRPADAQRPTTLAELLHEARPDWATLESEHGALLELVEMVLGVVPNCDRYLEIWPPAFRTYNVMVPNLLNLPVPVLPVGGPPPAAIGLAMYVASRTAECSYCSAHSCSFAMRRGASPETLAAALLPDRPHLSRGELATIAVARSLAAVRSELTAAEKAELIDVYGERDAEWIVLSVVMMGFLNKFMDTLGVELEQPIFDEVRSTVGPDWSTGRSGAELDLDAAPGARPATDGFRTLRRLLPVLPAAIRYDRRVQRHTPTSREKVRRHLNARVGHEFPVLAALRSGRARRAIATMLVENLDPATTTVGIHDKLLAGAAYAAVVEDATLAADMRALAAHVGLDNDALEGAAALADDEAAVAAPRPNTTRRTVLTLAVAAAPTPARVDPATLDACRDLSPQQIVEIVTWLALLQMLHRLTRYTNAR